MLPPSLRDSIETRTRFIFATYVYISGTTMINCVCHAFDKRFVTQHTVYLPHKQRTVTDKTETIA